MSVTEKSVNRDLLLRENLAIQRTIMANQSTFLSFLRTSMYFLVASLSIDNLFQMKDGAIFYQILLYTVSLAIFVFGVINYFRQNRKINESKIHIGAYKADYLA
jgi:putative membrane protein